ncbi:hypothetical protein [Microseira wollei]|uniref:Uncharacterized protein n=1 Tax=Microseira wollei NIES-4236 TaxID=2530354 RepID=A0AAV3X835_9CYAN|nr:hypothetical protein [Microseira wollei]GET36220.1 hypothetical protein MiSe_09680 [Microseira wollei NIES-4236]
MHGKSSRDAISIDLWQKSFSEDLKRGRDAHPTKPEKFLWGGRPARLKYFCQRSNLSGASDNLKDAVSLPMNRKCYKPFPKRDALAKNLLLN